MRPLIANPEKAIAAADTNLPLEIVLCNILKIKINDDR
jgi:hypothetical protein